MPYLITIRQEYDYAVSRGFVPLLDTKHFEMDICLRIDIQREVFGHCVLGRGNIPVANDRYYHWIWNNKPHVCEETMRPLHNYSAVFVSHILSRGAHPEMAHDPRNCNLLCFEAHNMWENGKRKQMRIYDKNMRTIEVLNKEYQSIV